MFTALLDTCVLWPSLQRDFLLSLAVVGLYRPVWSSAILDELQYHEGRKLIKRGTPADEADQRSQRLIIQMRRAFNDAEVEGWERLEGTFGLPDEDDEHVVAAAVVGGAAAIVTSNISDFPAKGMPPAIQIVKPADFAANTVAVDPVRAWEAIAQIVSRSGKRGRRLTEDNVLDILIERYGMSAAVDLLRGDTA